MSDFARLGKISTNNSTTATLSADATFTGTGERNDYLKTRLDLILMQQMSCGSRQRLVLTIQR